MLIAFLLMWIFQKNNRHILKGRLAKIIGTNPRLGLLELDGHEQKQKPLFYNNWKPAMVEIAKPFPSDLIGMRFYNPVFPTTTCTPIYQFQLKIIYCYCTFFCYYFFQW